MREWSVTTVSPEQTRSLGRLLGEILPAGALLLLTGDLGAGKTCFVQGLARGLGVPEDEPVTSPSYTLMNQYAGRATLHHFDLYRLGGTADLLDLGFEEYLDGAGVTVVEWADRAEELPQDALRLHLDRGDDEGRRIVFRAEGGLHVAVLARLELAWLERGKR